MRHGGVVGIDKPYDRAALRAFDRPRDRARTWQLDFADDCACGQITQGHLTDAMTRMSHQQLR